MNQKRTRPTFEMFKRNHPERYAQLLTATLKLTKDVATSEQGKAPPLDWWEPRLGFLLMPAYERRQVLRGILDEISLEWETMKFGSNAKTSQVHKIYTRENKIRRISPTQRTLDAFFED